METFHQTVSPAGYLSSGAERRMHIRANYLDIGEGVDADFSGPPIPALIALLAVQEF